ncbi:DUF2293 domain-containing protein [Magnetospirillum sp. UT-4]|uniref:DUF2293 domain-containing protein n=1 Tax=Magnetospirillum sp. UT-4 TaxID=2681467 RepID=UPI00137D0776|nr:DUF2293 domain-containing protein [Magnetospirillum sp. UT-4]CAA7612913.1 conserved hypothetical protein [Magnetospirillum sp. UT-4]
MTTRRGLIAEALRRIAPLVPDFERGAILDHAVDSPGLAKASPEAAAWLSLTAHVRHLHTEYDQLLAEGYDADSARHFVLEATNAVLADWGCRKRVGD